VQTTISNAQIVLADKVVHGTLIMEDDVITQIDDGITTNNAIDFGGDYLIPGIIDIHTDNLERHYFPRPNINWNPVSAAIAHDGVCIASGVTTVLDSLALGAWDRGEARGLDNLRHLVKGISTAQDGGALRATHFMHWRCELPISSLPRLLDEFVPHPMTKLASLMDHTPGQRQYMHLDFFLDRTWRKEMNEAEVQSRLAQRLDDQAANVESNRAYMSQMGKQFGLILAAHDDQTVEHVQAAHAAGAVISEFPVTAEAAEEARRLGMLNIMGGPNLIRGGSYSGNVSAHDLANDNLLDGFASDYVPRSLIECAFRLPEEPHGWSLPDAVATVTRVPARAVGLEDRGEIAVGQRADILRVSKDASFPVVRSVWVAGQRVA
jgi:alpha-D-ribose 1-methylphosphonate 5-triphosphate diphosphatase